MDWILVGSFLVCWPLAAYLFWKWDIGAYRSEYERKKKGKK
jgi:hypothetical protein